METREIVFSIVKSNKSNNVVWAVSITGEDQPVSAYCKSPIKALRFMFFLKKQTGCRIAKECITALSASIAGRKTKAEKASKDAAEVTQSSEPSEAALQ